MEMRVCKTCGREFPKTREFFYFSSNRFSSVLRWDCKDCYRAKVKAHEKSNIQPAERFPFIIKKGFVDCKHMDRECNLCFMAECRYHMVAVPRGSVDSKEVAQRIERAKCTCLFEIINSSDRGLTYDQIGDILGVSKQRVERIEERAFKKLRKVGRHLEDYAVDEVSSGYTKPESVIGRDKISEKTLIPRWNPKNFDDSATVPEQESQWECASQSLINSPPSMTR